MLKDQLPFIHGFLEKKQGYVDGVGREVVQTYIVHAKLEMACEDRQLELKSMPALRDNYRRIECGPSRRVNKANPRQSTPATSLR